MAILGNKDGTTGNLVLADGMEGALKRKGLAGWLEYATDQLAAPARERITREIEAHYADAVQAHIDGGEPEAVARTAALTELGDPTKAAADFRKRHLTEREAKCLQYIASRAPKPLFSLSTFWDILAVLGGVLFLSLLTRRLPPPDAEHFRWVLTLNIFLMFAGHRLIPRWLFINTPPGPAYTARLALCSLLLGVAFLLTMSGLFYLGNHDLFFSVLMGFIYSVNLNPFFRIWRKLRRSTSDFDELPPVRAASA
jgi:hypothetical protein